MSAAILWCLAYHGIWQSFSFFKLLLVLKLPSNWTSSGYLAGSVQEGWHPPSAPSRSPIICGVCGCTLYLHLLQHSIYNAGEWPDLPHPLPFPLMSWCGHMQGMAPALLASNRVLVYVQWTLCFNLQCASGLDDFSGSVLMGFDSTPPNSPRQISRMKISFPRCTY